MSRRRLARPAPTALDVALTAFAWAALALTAAGLLPGFLHGASRQ